MQRSTHKSLVALSGRTSGNQLLSYPGPHVLPSKETGSSDVCPRDQPDLQGPGANTLLSSIRSHGSSRLDRGSCCLRHSLVVGGTRGSGRLRVRPARLDFSNQNEISVAETAKSNRPLDWPAIAHHYWHRCRYQSGEDELLGEVFWSNGQCKSKVLMGLRIVLFCNGCNLTPP